MFAYIISRTVGILDYIKALTYRGHYLKLDLEINISGQ